VPWTPTPGQVAAAERLTREGGGFVRTHDDGTAEVRTSQDGEVRHYIVAQDGEAELVIRHARTRRYAFAIGLSWAGTLLIIGAVGSAALGLMPDWVATAPFVLGFAAFFAGMAINPSPRQPKAERWTWIGGPDF
jgi:hypothetical protein